MIGVALTEDTLGTLALDCDPFVVTAFDIGSPAERPVMRLRALADGAWDDSGFVGARAVTVSVRLRNHSAACATATQPTMQALYDRFLPYMHPRYRPRLSWALPGSPNDVRSLVVRGVSAPITLTGPKYPTLIASFVSSDGTITSAGPDGAPECLHITPSGDIVGGRQYDLTFPRDYTPSLGPGDRILFQRGNAPAHWKGVIYGAVTTPQFRINGVEVRFDNNGGVVLPAGSYIAIDTQARTMLLNGVPADSRYDRTNFTEWTWDDLMLKPGENLVRFAGTAMSPTASMDICWFPTWAG